MRVQSVDCIIALVSFIMNLTSSLMHLLLLLVLLLCHSEENPDVECLPNPKVSADPFMDNSPYLGGISDFT